MIKGVQQSGVFERINSNFDGSQQDFGANDSSSQFKISMYSKASNGSQGGQWFSMKKPPHGKNPSESMKINIGG